MSPEVTTRETREARYAARWADQRAMVIAIATKLAGGDPQLQRDLIQTGRITLWELDTSRARDPKSYTRYALRNKMIDELRRVRPERETSLDVLLEDGWALDADPWTGERRLAAPRAHQRGNRPVVNQHEDAALADLDAQTILQRLPAPEDRRLLRYAFGFVPLPGVTTPHGATYKDLARTLARWQRASAAQGDRPLSEATVRYRLRVLLADLQVRLTANLTAADRTAARTRTPTPARPAQPTAR
jgi:DNA-directed RNA polymerase specialized sigma24 family protein